MVHCDEVLGQVEEERLGPLEVVDRKHHRPCRGERAEEAAHGEEGLVGRRRRSREEARDARRDARMLRLTLGYGRLDRRAEPLARRGVAEAQERPERLGERRERGAPRRVAAGCEHGRLGPERTGELVEEARFAEAGGAEDDDQARTPGRDGRLVGGADAAELVPPADERRRGGARGAFERHHPVRGDGLRAAAEAPLADGLERHPLAHQTARRVADQHVAVRCLLLEPRRDVHRIADDVRVVVADDDLSRVDGDAEAEVGDAELAEGALHGDRGAHGVEGVVLAHARHAEGGHHAVAEELHDGAAVRLRRSRGASDSTGPSGGARTPRRGARAATSSRSGRRRRW